MDISVSSDHSLIRLTHPPRVLVRVVVDDGPEDHQLGASAFEQRDLERTVMTDLASIVLSGHDSNARRHFSKLT